MLANIASISYDKRVKKLPFLLFILFVLSLFTSTTTFAWPAAGCPGLERVPLSISPSSGLSADTYKATISWDALPDSKYQEYRNNTADLSIGVYENGNLLIAYPIPRPTENIKRAWEYSFSNIPVTSGSHNLQVELDLGGQNQCRNYETLVQSLTIQNPQSGYGYNTGLGACYVCQFGASGCTFPNENACISYKQSLLPTPTPVRTCTINGSPTAITKGINYTVNAAGLTPDTFYELQFTTTNFKFEKNAKTDASGTLSNASFTIVTGHPIQNGSYSINIVKTGDFRDKCTVGTLPLQSAVAGTIGYQIVGNSCSSCTIGSDPTCNYADFGACSAAINAAGTPIPTATPKPRPLAPCAKYININEPDPNLNDVTAIVTSEDILKTQYKDLQYRCESYESALGAIETDPTKFIARIFAILLSLSGVLVIYFIITAGYKLMMSQGNAEEIQGARETITSAIVGLLFLIFSMIILEVIGISIFHIPGFNP